MTYFWDIVTLSYVRPNKIAAWYLDKKFFYAFKFSTIFLLKILKKMHQKVLDDPVILKEKFYWKEL